MSNPHIGPCELLDEIGSSSRSRVHLARLTTSTGGLRAGRCVVAKLRPATSDGHRSLAREAGLMARAGKGAVPRVLAHGLASTPAAPFEYLILEHVPGRSLRDLLDRQGVLPASRARSIGQGLAASLAKLHEARIVHGDIKPENVLVADDGRVILIDLSASVDLDDPARDVSLFSGTLAWAAPEILEGDLASPASDLYSVGLVLAESLGAGLPVHSGSASELLELRLEHAGNMVLPVEPPWLRALLQSLLAPRPSARLTSASLLARTLKAGERSAWWSSQPGARLGAEIDRLGAAHGPSFVGRSREMTALRAAWAAAASGERRGILLSADAGAGKSRLVSEFLLELVSSRTPPWVLVSTSDPGDAKSTILSSLLASALRTVPGLRGRLRQVAGSKDVARALVHAASQPDDPRKSSVLEAATLQVNAGRLMSSLALERGLVLVIEDLHLRDAADMGSLRQALLAVRDACVMVIGTTRPLATGGTPWGDELLGPADRLDLAPLSARAMDRLVSPVLGDHPQARLLRERIAVASRGNPLLGRELATQFAGSTAGAAREALSLARMSLPDTVSAALAVRLRRLDAKDRRLLLACALQGHSFDPRIAARALDLPDDSVLAQLSRLERLQYVRCPVPGTHAFRHHAVHAAASSGATPSIRKALHDRLARALMEAAGTDGGRVPEDCPHSVAIARHLLRGAKPASAMAWLPPALAQLAKSLHHQAVDDLATDALTIVPGTSPSERRLLFEQRASARGMLGQRDGQLEDLELAQCAAREARSPPDIMRLQNEQSAVLHSLGRFAESATVAHATISEDLSGAPENERCVAWRHLGAALSSLGRQEEARVALEQAMDSALRSGNRVLEARVHAALSRHSQQSGRVPDALTHGRRAHQLSVAAGSIRDQVTSALVLGVAEHVAGRLRDAARCYAETERLARQGGHALFEALGAMNLANVEMLAGHWSAAMPRLRRAAEMARVLEARMHLSIILANAGNLECESGRHLEALALLEEACSLTRAMGHVVHDASVRRHWGLALQASGRLAEAEEAFEVTLRTARGHGLKDIIAYGALALGRLHLESGSGSRARDLFREALQAAPAPLPYLDFPLPVAYLALLGDVDPLTVRVPRLASRRAAAETRWALHVATGDFGHLLAAREDLLSIARSLSTDSATRFWRDARVPRLVRLSLADAGREEASIEMARMPESAAG